MKTLLETLKKFKNDNTAMCDTIEVEIKSIGSWPETTHAVDKKDVLAMVAAMGSQRALLLTGAPGVGKSHLARVAASITERYFISVIIKPDDEIGDLLWSIDHTKRLSDAQLFAALKKGFDDSLKFYIRPGAVWHAFEEPEDDIISHFQVPEQKATREDGVVLLIDEIDKASVSLLNSLLEVLGNMSFDIPILDKTIGSRQKPPLIILTSNDDIDLPAPLLRRCVCHEVSLPTNEDAFVERMNMIAKAKMGKKNYSKKVADACALLIYKHRLEKASLSGASEFVDMLNTLQKIEPKDKNLQVNKHLDSISQYFLKD